MLINEYDDKNDPLVLLLSPMMVSGEELYQLMHPYFTALSGIAICTDSLTDGLNKKARNQFKR